MIATARCSRRWSGSRARDRHEESLSQERANRAAIKEATGEQRDDDPRFLCHGAGIKMIADNLTADEAVAMILALRAAREPAHD